MEVQANLDGPNGIAVEPPIGMGAVCFELPVLTERLRELLLAQPLNPLRRPVLTIKSTAERASGALT